MPASTMNPKIEVLEEPHIEVHGENTHQVLALQHEPNPEGTLIPRAIGQVVQSPSFRWIYGLAKPETSTIDTRITGMVGEGVVYDKKVASRNESNFPIPFHGLRVAISRKRAAKQVLSGLSRVP